MNTTRPRVAMTSPRQAFPRLRDGLAVFALEGNRVRVGLAEPVVFDDLTRDEASFIARLEGTPRYAEADIARYAHVIRRLARSGLLSEAPPAPVSAADQTPSPHRSSVCVIGADALGAAVGLSLAQAGVGCVILEDGVPRAAEAPGGADTRAARAARSINGWVPRVARACTSGGGGLTSDIAVVVATGSPAITLMSDLMSADQAHLPLVADERGVTIGPLVVPGRGPCMTCVGMHRTERDPDWPWIALQCNGERPSSTSAAARSLAAGVACDAVLRYLNEPGPDPRQWRIECPTPDAPDRPAQSGPTITAGAVSSHPSCGCTDSLMLGDDLQDLDAILF